MTIAMRNIRGFSLLELLVVVALIAILTGLAVLGHRGIRQQLHLHMAARQVMMDLKLARMRAVREHVNYRIAFAGGGAGYQMQRKTGSAYRDDGAPTPLPRGIWITDCTARDDAIMFVPRGSAGSFGTITLGNENGESRHVVVDIAGRMRVY